MSKAKELLALIEDQNSYLNKAIDPLRKQIKKDGLITTPQGKDLIVQNPKTKKKIILRDNGKSVKVNHSQQGKTTGKDDQIRGSTSEIDQEINWLKTK